MRIYVRHLMTGLAAGLCLGPLAYAQTDEAEAGAETQAETTLPPVDTMGGDRVGPGLNCGGPHAAAEFHCCQGWVSLYM